MEFELNASTILLIVLIVLLLIVSYQFYFCIDNFANISDNTPTLYVFVSKTCPHCVTYNEKTHPMLEKAFANENTNIKIKRVFADQDPEKLFDKFNVEFVPTFWCVKGNKKEQVSQDLDPKTLQEKFKSL